MTEECTPKESRKPKPLSISQTIGHWFVILLCAGVAYLTFLSFFRMGNSQESTFILLFFSIFIIGTTLLFSYRLVVPISRQKYLGNLPANFLRLLVGIGLVTAIVAPQFQYCISCKEGHDRVFLATNGTKSNLHNLYLSCKAYWAEASSDKGCRLDIASSTAYGFVQSDGVIIEGHGTESTFTATAQHPYHPQPVIFAMDTNGQIEERLSDVGNNLFNLHSKCRAYWDKKGDDQDCRVETVTTAEYGFVQSDRVTIEGYGTRTTFFATAKQIDSTTSYTIDASGSTLRRCQAREDHLWCR